jgi:hypothetical protein
VEKSINRKRSEKRIKMIMERVPIDYNDPHWTRPYYEADIDSSYVEHQFTSTGRTDSPFLTGIEQGYIRSPVLTYSDLLLGRTDKNVPPVTISVGLTRQYPNSVNIHSSGIDFNKYFQLAENVITGAKSNLTTCDLVHDIFKDHDICFGPGAGPSHDVVREKKKGLRHRKRSQITRIKTRIRKQQNAKGIWGDPDIYRSFLQATTLSHQTSDSHIQAGEDLSLPLNTSPF